MTTRTATRQAAPVSISFDERLAFAGLAFDVRIDSKPLDLADVIRIPVDELELAAATATPLAACLRRAHDRITRDGWTTGQCRTSQAKCAYEAIRAESDSPGQAAAATSVLLDTIRREFPDAATVPAWNDEQRDASTVLRMFNQAARDAQQQGI